MACSGVAALDTVSVLVAAVILQKSSPASSRLVLNASIAALKSASLSVVVGASGVVSAGSSAGATVVAESDAVVVVVSESALSSSPPQAAAVNGRSRLRAATVSRRTCTRRSSGSGY